jgi:hypothetical protein
MVDGQTFNCDLKEPYTEKVSNKLRELVIDASWLSIETISGDTLILNKAALNRSIFIITETKQ